jgi:hypothetical protein
MYVYAGSVPDFALCVYNCNCDEQTAVGEKGTLIQLSRQIKNEGAEKVSSLLIGEEKRHLMKLGRLLGEKLQPEELGGKKHAGQEKTQENH